MSSKFHFLQIDNSIRDWVLFPLVIIVLLFTIIRDYLYKIINSTSQTSQRIDYSRLRLKKQQKTFRDTQVLSQTQLLQMHGQNLPKSSFEARRLTFTHPERGLLQQNFPAVNFSQLTDPAQVTNMLKDQMMGIAPNLALWGLVSHFFSGYIVAKFPFSLTTQFRGMLQRGIEQLQLDVSYVTSASIYFIILFGLQGIQVLLLGNEATNTSSQMVEQQMGIGKVIDSGGPNPQMMFNPQQQILDMGNAYRSQRENLNMIQHEFSIANEEAQVVERLERRYK